MLSVLNGRPSLLAFANEDLVRLVKSIADTGNGLTTKKLVKVIEKYIEDNFTVTPFELFKT
tara:strand:- start:215 stop:397 length:183 start_codon:yes stop_codon:yes gene_type:complete